MYIPSVKTIRRILAGVIGVVALAALLNYLVVASRRPRDDENLPPMISAELRHAAEGVEIFVRKGSDLRFTVHARQLRETIQDRSFLEGVEASDFNQDGSVRNSIYSDGAVYDPDRGVLDFDGGVRVLLGDGSELRAQALHYDLNEEIGVIPGEMKFFSSNVSGMARDARFFRDKDMLELGGEVDFSLTRDNSGAAAELPENAIRASASRGTCLLAENRIMLSGGVRIESPDAGALSAGAVDMKLNSDRSKITYMTASGKVVYETRNHDETRNVSGGRMVFTTGTTGALEKVRISERADMSVKSTAGEQTLRAGEIELFLDSASGSISEITGTTGAELLDRRGTGETLAAGDAIYADFADAGVRNVRLTGRSRFAITGTGNTANELRADAIEARFRAESDALEIITATGGARWVFEQPGAAARTMLASKLEVRYAGNYPESGAASGSVTLEESDAAKRMTRRLGAERMLFDFFSGTGQVKSLSAETDAYTVFERTASPFGYTDIEKYETYSDGLEAFFVLSNGTGTGTGAGTGALWRVEQRGNFRFISGERSASADYGEYDADNEKLTLTGSPEIFDKTGRLTGARIEYDIKSNELLARGSVLVVLDARQSKSTLLQSGGGASPVVVTAEELRYWAAAERFRFLGNVAALTESQQISAREITIDGTGNMAADGGVLHRIYETGFGSAAAGGTVIESRQMEYRRGEGEIRYHGKVEMKSGELTFTSDELHVTLDDEEKGIRRILAEGNVLIRHDGRVGSGDAAQWIPATSGFIVTGNPAIIDDPERGRSTARRLTYFRNEDRITLEP